MSEQNTDFFWYNPQKPPFSVCGFPFFAEDGLYRRYPLRPEQELPKETAEQAACPSGGQIRFRAQTGKITIRVKLEAPCYLQYNSVPLCNAGFDLYASDGDRHYTMIGVSRFDVKADHYEYTICNIPMPDKPLDFVLHFPITMAVESILIGVEKNVEILPPLPFAEGDRGKILIYGGSITQGYCADRPGMTLSNQLCRRMHREIYDLGISGGGRCEDSIALCLNRVQGVSWLILSPEGNCPTVEWLDEHLRSLLRIVRTAHPEWNIAVMSFMREGRERFQTDYAALRLAKRDCERQIVADLNAAGDDKIVFWDGGSFTDKAAGVPDVIAEMGEDCTMDIMHKSDMGFYIMAREIEARMREYEKLHNI